MTEAVLARASVRRVQDVLAAGGSLARVVVLADSARTAQMAADALGVPVGAIVKSLVFLVGGAPVVALVAGDRRCDTDALSAALGLDGRVGRADADAVRAATGFAIGGVSPLGYPAPLPMALDASLRRFERLFAAAGHPNAVFPTDFAELQRLTGAREAAIATA
jgi:prolyl-tRNA editing enzyme YbaK/EbsC (Cys-tRNA(Pro) deacylase)